MKRAPDHPLAKIVRAAVIAVALGMALPGCSLLPGSKADDANGAATANGGPGADSGSTQPESAFDIVVQSENDALRALVQKHNNLQRYRVISDLDATELKRLTALTEDDVRGLLATQGYFNPDITVSTRTDDDGRTAVVINMKPGERTHVTDVDIRFSGDIASSVEAAGQRREITDGWTLKQGRTFTQDTWSEAKNNALRQLVSRRYAKGRIGSSRADVDAAGASASVAIELDSGPPYHLGPATVRGAERYPAELPERLSWLQPGDVYDQKELIDAQQRLAGSGYYDSAWINIDPDGDPAAVPVRYVVTEAKQKKLKLGVGFSTDSGLRTTAEHRNNTFWGTSWRSDTTLQVETKEPLAQVEFTSLPHASGWSNAVLARYMRQDDGLLNTLSKTGKIGIIKTRKKYDRNLYLQFDHALVTGSGGAAVPDALLGDGAAVSLHYAWTGRYFDSMVMPTRGYGLKVDVGGGMTLIGKKYPFARLTGRWLGLLPVGKGGSRLQFNAEGGFIVANGQARLPGSYMFRTGGDTTVRGYGYREIGIPLGNDIVGPGRYMELGSLEWQRPVLQERFPGMLEHILFIDVGSVSNHTSDFNAHWGVGTGVRAITPVGPMELDLAYGLKNRDLRLHLNVGFTF
ncbi:MAG: BamA/TamA family outer membrane protein [Ottowia sp.]|nr:BamA/TamA family outer membrane protein [Ottowia sp.]